MDAARDAAEINFLTGTGVPEHDDPAEPEQASFRHMVEFVEDLLVAELEGVMGAMASLSPEEALIAKEEWKVTTEALAAVVPDVKPERLDLLKKHYGEGLNLKQTAAAQGLMGSMTTPCMLPGCVPGGPGQVMLGSFTVLIGNKPAARVNDMSMHPSCVAPIPSPVGKIMPPGVPTVMIGG